ncbi:hypothetical protein ACFQO4_19180 [Saliphagus sp. GCM10025334]
MTLEERKRDESEIDREEGRPARKKIFQYAGTPVRYPKNPVDDRDEGTLADELEDRIDGAINGDVAKADDIKDAFLSSN